MSYEKNMEIVKNKLDILMKNNEIMTKDIEKLLDKQVPESQLLEINKMVDSGINHCNTVKEILDKGPDSLNSDYYSKVHKAAIECEKANKEISQAIKNLLDYMDKGSNKLLSNINLEGFYSYLNSLSLVEISALFHIFVLSVILLLLLNVLTVVLGNEIINFFKIEEKFPKLIGVLRLRMKFQKYYLILNFSLIFILAMASILIDLLVLI